MNRSSAIALVAFHALIMVVFYFAVTSKINSNIHGPKIRSNMPGPKIRSNIPGPKISSNIPGPSAPSESIAAQCESS